MEATLSIFGLAAQISFTQITSKGAQEEAD